MQGAFEGGVALADTAKVLGCEAAACNRGGQPVNERPDARATVVARGHQHVATGCGVKDPLAAAHYAPVS